eukprot:scaffold26859_cov59-Cyclotella_meneghiniana.AAC.8
MMLSGRFLSAFLASLATQQTASKPRYPKKELIDPRKAPRTQNSGGINGLMLSLLNSMNPITQVEYI